MVQKPPSVRLLARTFFVPLLAYALAVLSVLMPISRANAIEAAGLDRTLAVLCLAGALDPSHSRENVPQEAHHDLACCTPTARLMLDHPVLLPDVLAPVLVPVRIEMRLEIPVPHGRAPPAITATPIQAQAPPAA